MTDQVCMMSKVWESINGLKKRIEENDKYREDNRRREEERRREREDKR